MVIFVRTYIPSNLYDFIEFMTFENIPDIGTLNCLSSDDIVENTTDSFCRGFRDSHQSPEEWKTLRENGKYVSCREGQQQACCKARGVSVDLISSDNEERIKEHYRELVKLKPRLSLKYFGKFSFSSNSGRVWKTPSSDRPTHCTFFKSDGFTIGSVIFLQVIEL